MLLGTGMLYHGGSLPTASVKELIEVEESS